MTALHKVNDMIAAAEQYAMRLTIDPEHRKLSTNFAWLELCGKMGQVSCDTITDADIARFDLGLDEEGNPTDEFGFSVRTFNPSRVHPNDLCQSKGYF